MCVVNKYILILQRTTSILKVPPLEESSVLSVSVWPLIHGKTSPSLSPTLSSQSQRHPSLSSNMMEEMRLIGSPLADNKMSPSPGSSFGSPHLAGKLRPGSAGLLRPVSAMSSISQASNVNESSVMLFIALAPLRSRASGFVVELKQACKCSNTEAARCSHDEP